MLSRSSPLLLGVKRILTLFFSLSRTGVIYWVKLDGFSLFCEKRERNGIQGTESIKLGVVLVLKVLMPIRLYLFVHYYYFTIQNSLFFFPL